MTSSLTAQEWQKIIHVITEEIMGKKKTRKQEEAVVVSINYHHSAVNKYMV